MHEESSFSDRPKENGQANDKPTHQQIIKVSILSDDRLIFTSLEILIIAVILINIFTISVSVTSISEHSIDFNEMGIWEEVHS